VVDDEKYIALVLDMGLRKAGFDIVAFLDSLQALSDFRPHVYDLLVLDVKMHGFELYCCMKTIDPDVKVCFLTAFAIPIEEFEKQFPNLDLRYRTKNR